MKIRHILLFSPAGLAPQIILFVFCGYLEKSNRLLLLSPYSPWLALGEILDRDSGAGGHAFAGGAILGILAGVAVYSLLMGALLGYVYEKKIRPRIRFGNLK